VSAPDSSGDGRVTKASKSVPAELDDDTSQTAMEKTFPMLQMGNKTPIASIENLRNLLDFHGITCRYNVISKQYEIIIPDEQFSQDNADIASLARVASRMAEVQLPTAHYKEYISYIGDANQYNPVLQWVTSKKWDGINRIDELCGTIKAKNEEAKNMFIRRWLITAMYMAMHDGYDSPGCLVLQGPQGLGKTWWFRKLCDQPNLIRTDANVDPRNRDSVSQVIRYWIVELGEIGSTFRRSDVDALKAFITSSSDILRRPYATTDQLYPRRTVLAASVNEAIYLHDPTGNRRFFTVQCTEINSYHKIDMQQLWAEVHNLIENCQETPHLTSEEKRLVDEINMEHMQIDPIEEMILSFYNWGDAMAYDWKTSTVIAADIGLKNISQKETRKIAEVVRKLNSNDFSKEKRSNGQLKFFTPEPRS
jgi:putative DNA primase/helicase